MQLSVDKLSKVLFRVLRGLSRVLQGSDGSEWDLPAKNPTTRNPKPQTLSPKPRTQSHEESRA